MPKINWFIRVILIFLGGFLNLVIYERASTQYDTDAWSQPINLSKSGSSTSPFMALDADGDLHAIWFDEYAGYVYTHQEGDAWSEPLPVELPFPAIEEVSELPLVMLGDDEGYIHAFWIDYDEVLFYSRVLAENFDIAQAWESSRTLAESAVDFDVAMDNRGTFHLAYVRTNESLEFGAGIYYRRSPDYGVSWTDGNGLYLSRYIRTLDNESAHVDLKITDEGGTQQIYLSWDDPLIKRIFLQKSLDGGLSWEPPLEIVGPKPDELVLSPYHLISYSNGDEVLLVWKVGLQSGFDCNLYYQYTQDDGSSWSDARVMLLDYVGCPEKVEFYKIEEDYALLQLSILDEIYFVAWNGEQWSEPQPQRTLFGFPDPITQEMTNLRCRQTLLTKGMRLFVVGCDIVGTEDIWLTWREFGDISEWYPPPSAWSIPKEIYNEGINISSLVAVHDQDGNVNLFWTQPSDPEAVDQDRSIFIAGVIRDQWSHPTVVLQSPDNYAGNIDITLDSSNRLLSVWQGNLSGEIYFSWAEISDQVLSPSDWTKPETLPTFRLGAKDPDILVDQENNIYISYVIPLNEERGVYLISSNDGGDNWSNPTKVFDAVAAGWSKVDTPHLAKTINGQLHIIWKRSPLPGSLGDEGLYYARSMDDGLSWTQPAALSEQSADWFRIYSGNSQGVHRFWLEQSGLVSNLWHDFSVDGGLTWSPLENLSRFGETKSFSSLNLDIRGNLHLLEIIEDLEGKAVLKYLVWDAGRWEQVDDYEFNLTKEQQIISITSTLTQDGRLYAIILVSEIGNTEGEQLIERILVTDRLVTIPQSESAQVTVEARRPLATATPMVTPAPSPQLTTTPILSSILTAVPTQGQTGSINPPFFDRWTALVLGAGIIFLLAVIIWVVRKRVIRSKKIIS